LLLHKRGWRGVNIDMIPGKIVIFDKLRPDDMNVVAALSNRVSEVSITRAPHDSGCTDRISDERSAAKGRTPTISAILSRSPWANKRIGYLNVDCEGHDIEVLEGIDLDIYRPMIITVEALERDKVEHLIAHLHRCGYAHKETLYYSLLFVRCR